MDPRARDRVALVGALAQIAGPLRDVGLDAHPSRGHACDPGDIVGAELDPVKRIGDRGARAGQVSLAPAQLGQQRPKGADPLRLGRPRDERLGLFEAQIRRLFVSDPEREFGLAQVAEDQLPAGELSRRRDEIASRGLPVPASNEMSDAVRDIQL